MPAASGSDPVRVERDLILRSLPIPRAGDRRAWPRRLLPIVLGLTWMVLGSILLHARIQGWERAGADVSGRHFLTIALASIFASAVITALAMLQTSISGDEALLLLTLPLSPADRLRIAMVRTAGDTRTVLTALSAAAGVVTMALSQPWWACVIAMALPIGFVIGSIGVIRGVCLWSDGSWPARGILLGGIASALALQILLRWSGRTPELDARMAAGGAFALMVSALFVITGGRATVLGRAYVQSVQIAGSPAASHTVRRAAGVTRLTGRLRQHRNPASAMIVKDLLVQSRDWFYSLRCVVTLAALPLFLLVRKLDLLDGWTTVQLAVCLAGILAIYSLVDTAPSPIGGEGERLGLWLLAPTSPGELLRAKLAVFLLPLLLQAAIMAGLIGIWSGLSTTGLVVAIALTSLMVIGPAWFLILGSSFDLRLELPLESGLPTTMHEHVPVTPHRLWLLNLSLLMTGLMVVAVWHLPLAGAAFALVIIDAVIAVTTWRASFKHLLVLA